MQTQRTQTPLTNVPTRPADSEYTAALARAEKKQLVVLAVEDKRAERVMWRVINPKSGSIHDVRWTQATNTLACDCESRVYCCCRAAVQQFIEAEEAARQASLIAEAMANAADHRAAVLYRNTSISIWR